MILFSICLQNIYVTNLSVRSQSGFENLILPYILLE